MGAFGLHLTTRELAQFGQLYLQHGRWHGQQLLPIDFVAASTVAHSRGGDPEDTSYGYMWWITVDQAGHEANSQTAERNDHKFHEARLINEALREDIRTGRAGLGAVLAQAAIAREISDTLHRHESRLKSIGDKSGKIDTRTKELKDKLIGKH